MKRYIKITYILFLVLFSCNITIFAQLISSREPKIISVNGNIRNDNKARVTALANQLDDPITVLLINEKDEKPIELSAKQKIECDYTCEEIKVEVHGNSKSTYGASPRNVWRMKISNIQTNESTTYPTEKNETSDPQQGNTPIYTPSTQNHSSYYTDDTPQKKQISVDEIIYSFNHYLINTYQYFSKRAIDTEKEHIGDHINKLKQWDDKEKYLREQGLEEYLQALSDTLESYRDQKGSLINDFLKEYKDYKIIGENDYVKQLEETVNYLLTERTSNINLLKEAIQQAYDSKDSEEGINWQLIAIIVGLALILVALVIWYKKTNKKNHLAQQRQVPRQVSAAEAASSIVVRRKTTSVLRKQSLEDVMDNDSYLAINCNEFCNDSAVRRIYIKNTCIKDIYNMYSEDLRNPNNPKEDGCMVLGRWVYDKDNNDYYVSLEHVVLPGDDAIFAEYELNFGGKIKLKVTEKLRKLRRDTGLQYDLTCWVHSHPGLGVFFSNSDSNVQMQLKHPTHPNFLTAIVVDILTPQQELGIFTFKKDSSINSKNDLTRMYSLEDLYQWAVESERNAFKSEDYFNTLVNTPSHVVNCYGIELSNGAIIDISRFAIEQTSGFVGMVHGFYNQQGVKTEAVAVTVNASTAVPDNELIGCFVIATHRSLPSIRKVVAPFIDRIKFALVYTTIDGMLTSIPAVNRDLCSDETYYGEQTLEDLKIWTRRKR